MTPSASRLARLAALDGGSSRMCSIHFPPALLQVAPTEHRNKEPHSSRVRSWAVTDRRPEDRARSLRKRRPTLAASGPRGRERAPAAAPSIDGCARMETIRVKTR